MRAVRTTVDDQTAGVRPVSFEQFRDLVRQRFKTHQYWILMFDQENLETLVNIEKKFYLGEAGNDLDVCAVGLPDMAYIVACGKKRRMQAYQLASIVPQCASQTLTEREMLERDILICTQPERLTKATELLGLILTQDSPELAIAQ